MELNRFKQLLESTIGNVKPLINEKLKFDPNDLLGAEDTIDGSDPNDEYEDDDELLGPEDRIDDKVTCPVCHVGVKNLTSHCRFRHKHHKCSRGH